MATGKLTTVEKTTCRPAVGRFTAGRVALGVVAALLLVLVGAAPAFAQVPWWHLNSGSRPSSIQPGTAKNEVQDVTVSATGGSFYLIEEAKFEFHAFKWDATSQEVQEGLEGIYGAGNVEVAGGPQSKPGEEAWTYAVTFVGGLAYRPVAPMLTFSALSGGKAEATVKQATVGAPDGKLVVTVVNLGDADMEAGNVPVAIADRLPPGLKAVGIEGVAGEAPSAGGGVNRGPVECVLASVSCSFGGTLAPYEGIEMVISVVDEGAKSGAVNEVSTTGGNAVSASARRPVSIGEPVSFGVEDYESTPEDEGGGIDTQAGSHPFQLTTTMTLNQVAETKPEDPHTVALAKDLNFKLPPGLIGNPIPFPQCTDAQFTDPRTIAADACPADTALGVSNITINVPGVGFTRVLVPLFNLKPSVGEPARFGFVVNAVHVYLDTSVRTGGDYGVTVSVDNISQVPYFLTSRVTFWGVPGDPRHDNARGWSCIRDGEDLAGAEQDGLPGCTAQDEPHPPPFLELPTSCTGPLQTSVEADSWAQPG